MRPAALILWRKHMGLTQAQAAHFVFGMSRTAYIQVEKGRGQGVDDAGDLKPLIWRSARDYALHGMAEYDPKDLK